MKEKYLILLFLSFFSFQKLRAQKDSSIYRNRIGIGVGGESGFMGLDYSHAIFSTKLFVGIGCGLGTGWTGYLHYEPFEFFRIHTFLSSGISHAFNETLIVTSGTTTFFASAGLSYFAKVKWNAVPGINIGLTYYSVISGDVEGGTFGVGPNIKFQIQFPRR